jgi:hypothetical protein
LPQADAVVETAAISTMATTEAQAAQQPFQEQTPMATP